MRNLLTYPSKTARNPWSTSVNSVTNTRVFKRRTTRSYSNTQVARTSKCSADTVNRRWRQTSWWDLADPLPNKRVWCAISKDVATSLSIRPTTILRRDSFRPPFANDAEALSSNSYTTQKWRLDTSRSNWKTWGKRICKCICDYSTGKRPRRLTNALSHLSDSVTLLLLHLNRASRCNSRTLSW